jgi:uncharacterized membrane protein
MTHEQKNIISIYALVTVGAILMLAPYALLPFAGFACMTVGFVSAYIYKWRRSDNAVMVNHMKYIIRTTWWATLILFIGVILFASIIISNGDLSSINALMDSAERGVVPTESDILAMQMQFVQSNLKLISISAIITLAPYPLYLIYRMVRGVQTLLRK